VGLPGWMNGVVVASPTKPAYRSRRGAWFGTVLAIVGFGRIGREVALRVRSRDAPHIRVVAMVALATAA
jgi:phosphoglycerate dehydrogenase-like enzyme